MFSSSLEKMIFQHQLYEICHIRLKTLLRLEGHNDPRGHNSCQKFFKGNIGVPKLPDFSRYFDRNTQMDLNIVRGTQQQSKTTFFWQKYFVTTLPQCRWKKEFRISCGRPLNDQCDRSVENCQNSQNQIFTSHSLHIPKIASY